MKETMMKSNAPNPRRRRGMVLVGLMMVLFLALAVTLVGFGGGGVVDGVRDSTFLARGRSSSYQAQMLADTGVRAVTQWLSLRSTAPTNTTVFRPSQVATFWNSAQNGNYDRITFNNFSGSAIGTIDVRIFPFSDNTTVTSKSYLVESVGTYQGKTQIVRAAVMQDTFAKYAFFSDNAPTGTFWTAGSTIFNGPVQVNARNMVVGSADYNANAAIKILWQNTSGKQIFKYNGDGAFSTSASSSQVTWYRGNQSTIAAPSTTTQWGYVAAGGSSTIKSSVAMVDMPTQSSTQADAAMGTPAATIPSGPSVTVPASSGATCGGVYINGDVDNMKLTASGSGNTTQGIEVFQNDGSKLIKTVVSISPTTGTTGQVTVNRFVTTSMTDTNYVLQTGGGYPQTFTGRTNGVIYVNGNVGNPGVAGASTDATPTTFATGGLSGKVANNVVSGSTVTTPNALTIVTNANNDLNIAGDVIYATTSGGNATTASGTLGIVSRRVKIIQGLTGDDSGDGVDNVTIHATVLAYDTFNAENPLVRNYLSLKAFNLLGGYIAKNPGTFSGIDANGNTLTGFSVNRNYDSRVAGAPPPFFPSTGNLYKIRSYQRVGTTL